MSHAHQLLFTVRLWGDRETEICAKKQALGGFRLGVGLEEASAP